MARIPSLPYRVIVTKKNGTNLAFETHNYPDLPGAMVYREIALRRSNTRKVEILMVLDESTPGHRNSAVTPPLARPAIT